MGVVTTDKEVGGIPSCEGSMFLGLASFVKAEYDGDFVYLDMLAGGCLSVAQFTVAEWTPFLEYLKRVVPTRTEIPAVFLDAWEEKNASNQ